MQFAVRLKIFKSYYWCRTDCGKNYKQNFCDGSIFHKGSEFKYKPILIIIYQTKKMQKIINPFVIIIKSNIENFDLTLKLLLKNEKY